MRREAPRRDLQPRPGRNLRGARIKRCPPRWAAVGGPVVTPDGSTTKAPEVHIGKKGKGRETRRRERKESQKTLLGKFR